MWTLWIVSSIINSAEPKYTRYAEFETSMSCSIEKAFLEIEFKSNEVAFCSYE